MGQRIGPGGEQPDDDRAADQSCGMTSAEIADARRGGRPAAGDLLLRLAGEFPRAIRQRLPRGVGNQVADVVAQSGNIFADAIHESC